MGGFRNSTDGGHLCNPGVGVYVRGEGDEQNFAQVCQKPGVSGGGGKGEERISGVLNHK